MMIAIHVKPINHDAIQLVTHLLVFKVEKRKDKKRYIENHRTYYLNLGQFKALPIETT